MATRVLPDAELEALATWPPEVARSDLAAYFTLSVEDLRWVRSFRSPYAAAGRLALAVQLCAPRFLGFVPAGIAAAPAEVVERLAERIGVDPAALGRYGREVSARSRREHVEAVIAHAGWRDCGRGEWKALGDWLVARALEHDTPSVLFRQVLERLRVEQVVRPGLDRLMRAVATARVTAGDEVYRRLAPLLTPERCARLDALLVTDAKLGVAPLVWLGDGATTASPESVKAELTKLAYLRNLGAGRLELSVVPPERLRQLATFARRSTPGALRQMTGQRRYPVLLAALAAGHTEIVDEVVRLFDQALTGTDSRARFKVAERQAERVAADAERLVLLDDILDVVLDNHLDDAGVGTGVRGLGAERLAGAARGEEERLPRDSGHLELMEASFSHVRSFAPQVLAALTFAASVSPSKILAATRLLQAMNAEGRRHVPETAPVEFVPARWRPYLHAARIAKLTEKRLWRPHPASHYQRWPKAGPLLENHAQAGLIAGHWDDLLRIGGSLKLGHVSAALLIARRQAGSRQHPLAKALLEYGKLLHTMHALRWFTDEAFRRRIGRQLNRGEALNDLRRFIFFAHRGAVRYPHHDDQTTQAHCHTLVINACILSTTGYLQDAIDARRAEGHQVSGEAIAHLSPAHFEAINPYGTLTFDIASVLDRGGRRPLKVVKPR